MKTRRRNYDIDRISALPDCLLLQILSNLKANQVVQLSILSTRWKYLWKHISVLSFKCTSYESNKTFANFVSQFLSFRDDKTSLQALTFMCCHYFDPRLLKRILKYLFSHNVQRLDMAVPCSLEHFPLSCNFSYHSLTSLKLIACRELKQFGDSGNPPVFPNSLKFPALTYLSLKHFAFRRTTDDSYADPFSLFQSLNTLILQSCDIFNVRTCVEDSLFISSVSLVNLTIVLPSLYKHYKFNLSTPNLSTFDFTGGPFQNLCGHNNITNTNFSCIKHVKIHIPFLNAPNFTPILFNWLLELSLIESLTISSKTLQILNLIPDSWKINFPYLHNLKLLKIVTAENLPPPDGTEDFLLQNAPTAKKVIFPGPTLKELLK